MELSKDDSTNLEIWLSKNKSKIRKKGPKMENLILFRKFFKKLYSELEKEDKNESLIFLQTEMTNIISLEETSKAVTILLSDYDKNHLNKQIKDNLENLMSIFEKIFFTIEGFDRGIFFENLLKVKIIRLEFLF